MTLARSVADAGDAPRSADRSGHPRILGGVPVRIEYGTFLIVSAAIVLAGVLVHNSLLYSALTAAGFLALVAISADLLLGYGGVLALGQVAFFGIGAYSGAIVTVHERIPPELGVLAACAAAVLAALLLSWVLLLEGFYFALATLTMVVLAVAVLTNWVSVTGGASGFLGIGPFKLGPLHFNSVSDYYWLAWVPALVAVLAARFFRLSRLGHATRLMRDNALALSLGVPTTRLRIQLWVAAAALAGTAGDLYMHYLRFIQPDTFGIGPSILVVAMAIIGGLGTAYGALIGSVLLEILTYELSTFGSYATLIYGVLLILVVLLAPKGIYAEIVRLARAGERRLNWGRGRAEVRQLLGWSRRGPGDAAPVMAADPAGILFDGEQRYGDGRVLLRAENISVSFGGIVALENVTLEVREGEVLGLIGPNGAGKSTLLDVIAGNRKPDAGRVSLFGEDVTRYPADRTARLGIIRTFQEPHIDRASTVLDNVTAGGYVRGTSGFLAGMALTGSARRDVGEMRRAAAWATHFVGLGARQEDRAAMLSSGELRLLALARALVAKPKVLLLDEPGAGLSTPELRRLQNVVEALRRRGLAQVVIEHHVPFVEAVTDRIAVLDVGHLLVVGETADVMANESVQIAYFGRSAQ